MTVGKIEQLSDFVPSITDQDGHLASLMNTARENKRLLARVAELEAERDHLRAEMEEHNKGCVESCKARGSRCDDYTSRGRLCPDCPRYWCIEIPDPREEALPTDQHLDLLSPDEQAKFIAAARAWNAFTNAPSADFDLYIAFCDLMDAAAEGFDSE